MKTILSIRRSGTTPPAPSGLRVTQFWLLSALTRYQANAGATTLERSRLRSTWNRTTRNLKLLIDAKLVTLKQGQSDARQREASLTRSGLARYEDAKTLWRQAQNDINRTLGSAQVASLHALFDGLLATLNGKVSEESAKKQLDRAGASRARATSISGEKR